MNFLAIDLGTSAVKALVVDERQHVLATSTVPLSTSRLHPHWSEQDPEDWWTAVCSAIDQLRAAAGKNWQAIAAIGLSGQMHGAVLLGGDDLPVRPAILWNDGRAHAEAALLLERIPGIGEISGVPPTASFTAPKLLWLQRHEPDTWRKTRRIVLPKDYIRLKITGICATDMCDAAGSLLFDSGNRIWSKTIMAACNTSPEMLPRAMEGAAVSGNLRADIASAWGLPQTGIPVAAGAGDAAAGAIGIGAINDGDAFISLGTSSQYFITRNAYAPAPASMLHTFCHGLPERWFQMAALLNGASCLAWIASVMGAADDIEGLLQTSADHYTAPSALLFLPYLVGERTPLNDPHSKGALYGLTPGATRSDIVQAVLEGVAFSLGHCQQVLADAGTTPKELAVIGGGSRSLYWMRILANVLGRPLTLYEGGEVGPAFGAARLARLAVTGESITAVCTPPPVKTRIEADPALVEQYRERLSSFRKLYTLLAPVFQPSTLTG